MIAYDSDTFCFNVSQTLKSTWAIYQAVLKVGIWELTLMHNKWLGITPKKIISKLIIGGYCFDNELD
jgi:hypothetical protein